MSFLIRTLFACTLLAALASAPAAAVVLNEIYYDHPGADAGYEFIELWNPADTTVSLAGFRLQAGDGAGPARWRGLWQGTAADVIPPRARFVLGEALVGPPPDRVITLGLENGPDAVRLIAPDGPTQTVGYGALTFAEYFEGAPAPDVDAGYSLARLPDGADTHDNASDFVALSPPTPGAPNRPERDVALVASGVASGTGGGAGGGAATADPPIVAPGEPVRLSGVLINRGAGPLQAGEAQVLLWSARAPDGPGDAPAPAGDLSADSLVAEDTQLGGLEAGDSLPVALSWAPDAPGAYRVALAARIDDDGEAGNDRLESYVRAGVGPLVVSEVMYAPRPGDPEWIEVRARGESVDLTRFRLADATGKPAHLDPRTFAELEPDSAAILTEDVDAFLAAHAGTRARVFACAPWPILNNTASNPGRPADRVVVSNERGCVSDAMTYEGGGPSGYSLERRDDETMGTDAGNWGVSALQGGTPLAPNSLLVPPSRAGLSLSARVWRRSAGPPRLQVAYRLGWERALLRVS
ncbi:MAG TPA: lamin tail domain-containing protein, partial [Candidatus Eisenbacteria bacterium]|nr:lamin tail domain-containing protein [Candidatus Eisenbacteria bacterium]